LQKCSCKFLSDAVHDLEKIVKEISAEMAERPDRGTVATYIPELANVDAGQFGLAIVDNDGRVFGGGDADTHFSIQSISKVFTLTLALGMAGDRLWRRVGREPSGSPFNSVVQLEFEKGIPRNPFINAGAIAVTDLILSGHQPREALGESSASSASWPTIRRSPSTRRSRRPSSAPASATPRSPTT
jgi:glutaminase